MSDNFLEHEPSANPTARAAAPIAHWLYAVFAFVLTIFLFFNIPFQTTYFEGVVWSKQPATWPSIAILGMLLAGLGHIVLLRHAKWDENPLALSEDIKLQLHAGEYAFWFVLYIFAVGYIGYLPSSIVFALFLGWRIGIRSLKKYLLLISTATIIVVLFKAILKVRIPGGELYNLLPANFELFFNTYL